MSFDKHYPNRKDWIKPYFGSRLFDTSCRPNGGCPYCFGNKTYKIRKQELAVQEQINEITKPLRGQRPHGF